MEHHVYFWLKEGSSKEAFENGLNELLKIPQIGRGIWSVPAKTPERPVTDHSWDYAIQLHFATLEDHDIYQECEAHDVFVESFRDTWAKVEVRDLA